MADDFIDNVRRRDAAEAARQQAIAPLQQPRTATNGTNLDKWLEKTFHNVVEDVRNTLPGGRNGRLRWGARRLGEISHGGLDEQRCKRELERAAQDNGLWKEDGARQCRATIESGWDKGVANPDDLSGKGTQQHSKSLPKSHSNGSHVEEFDEQERRVFLRRMSTVKMVVPQWVWTYNNVGRIQMGTLAMFAGRPSAGKSTAARWFAARISNGELPGIWEGTPMQVAMYGSEEQLDAVVVPGLVAAGANMNNVLDIGVEEDGYEDGLLSVRDEHRLTDQLRTNNVRALFVDPVMSTFDSKIMDAHKNTDVRRHLSPYVRIAQAIKGVVIIVTHLRKGQVRDVMENINGSSAFGELPRAVFGFAAAGDGTNVMEQVKNNAGPAGLKLQYHLPIEYLTTDDGQPIELPTFEIACETEISVIDLSSDRPDEDVTTAIADAIWLEDYLLREQPAASVQIKRDARDQADISEYRLHKARKKLHCKIINQPTHDKPHQTAWCLPDWKLP